MKRRMLLLALAALVASVGTAAAAKPPVTVFLVRHAEKAKGGGDDPALSREGRHRSQVLATLLGEVGPTHLLSTEYRRTRDTLLPLAARAGLEVEVIPARDGEALMARLRALPPGAVAVVAGHSNTVPAIVRALGGTFPEETLEESDYGLLVQVILDKRRLTYRFRF